jgi:hypothetical protein
MCSQISINYIPERGKKLPVIYKELPIFAIFSKISDKKIPQATGSEKRKCVREKMHMFSLPSALTWVVRGASG